MSDWEKILVNQSETLGKAIEVLDTGSQRIVLAVDADKRLVGVVTDGDIRRALIGGCNMTAPISDFMSREPTTALPSESKASILSIMKAKDILHIPLVDEEGIVVGLEKLQELTNSVLYDNPVFIMAGGFGTRLRPLTDTTPKPLLKIGDKPMLELILESFISQGFHNFYFSTHYKAEMIREYFGNGEKWGVKITYVHESEPLGTGGALGLLPEGIADMPILMMNGDLLTKVSFSGLVDFHNTHGGEATMCVREYDYQVPYGVVSANSFRVKEIVEKPIHKFFVNAGIYVISPELRSQVDGTCVVDMPDLLQSRLDEGVQVNIFPVHEYWLDIGQMADYERAQSEIKEIK